MEGKKRSMKRNRRRRRTEEEKGELKNHGKESSGKQNGMTGGERIL